MPWIETDTTKNKVIPHEIPDKPYEVTGTNSFKINNSTLLCDVNCHIKSLLTQGSRKTVSRKSYYMYGIALPDYVLPRKIKADMGTIF